MKMNKAFTSKDKSDLNVSKKTGKQKATKT